MLQLRRQRFPIGEGRRAEPDLLTSQLDRRTGAGRVVVEVPDLLRIVHDDDLDIVDGHTDGRGHLRHRLRRAGQSAAVLEHILIGPRRPSRKQVLPVRVMVMRRRDHRPDPVSQGVDPRLRIGHELPGGRVGDHGHCLQQLGVRVDGEDQIDLLPAPYHLGNHILQPRERIPRYDGIGREDALARRVQEEAPARDLPVHHWPPDRPSVDVRGLRVNLAHSQNLRPVRLAHHLVGTPLKHLPG
jgi:hypothetical protein